MATAMGSPPNGGDGDGWDVRLRSLLAATGKPLILATILVHEAITLAHQLGL